jgi:hypothetical protein
MLAFVASLVLVGLLLHNLHSADATATLVVDQGLNLLTSGSQGMKAVFLQFHEVPDDDDLRRLFEAGIRVPVSAGIEGHPEKAYGVMMPEEIADAVMPGDELVVRSRRLRLGAGEHFREWTRMRCEVRRGETVRILDAPENGKFAFVSGAIALGPIALWSLAAGIVAVAGALPKPPRGLSTRPPDSRGTPGSP